MEVPLKRQGVCKDVKELGNLAWGLGERAVYYSRSEVATLRLAALR